MIAINPKNAMAWRKRGDVRRALRERDLPGALADYEQALRIAPDDPVTICHRGTLWYYNRDSGRAEADFRRAHALDPEYHEPLNNLGYLAAMKGDLDTAISYYSKAIALQPDLTENAENERKLPRADYAAPYANRGHAHFRKHDCEKALKDFDKALDVDPTDWMVLVDRGDTKAAMNDLMGAVADYTRALDLNAYYAAVAGAYAKRGEVYKRLGNDAKALDDFERSKAFEPSEAVRVLSK